MFGAVVSGRPPSLPGVDSMIGLFINTIPVRVRVSPQTPLLLWLRELQNAQAEARRFDYVSLAQVQAWSEVPRGQSLFESLVVFENYPIGTVGSQVAASLGLTEASSGSMGNYPLSLAAFPGASVRLKIEFDPSRIEPLTAERVLSHLEQILEHMTRCPDGCLGDLMRIATEEKRQMVNAFNEDLED
jgi:non-ribosomal peptide synthetase component F